MIDPRRLREALQLLAPGDREVFARMCDGQDYSHIAASFGITIAEVERRFAQALLDLQDRLQ